MIAAVLALRDAAGFWLAVALTGLGRSGRHDAGAGFDGVLMMELTGHARGFAAPLILLVALATLVARTIEPRSIYDARLSDAEVARRQRQRDREMPAGDAP